MSATVANVQRSESSHFYFPDGTPCYEVENKSKGGMRPTTLRDAKKLGLLPSVTTILRVLHREGLVRWLCEQACLAVLTAPRLEGEELDAFVDRVLNQERQQEQEVDKARDLGTRIHAAIEDALTGTTTLEALYLQDIEMFRWLDTPIAALRECGRLVWAEKVLVGNGYAGKADAYFEGKINLLVDLKTTSAKELPKKSYPEHRMQLAAYAMAVGNTGDTRLHTANLYISTTEPGKMSLCLNADWQQDYQAFSHLVSYYRLVNGL